LKPAKQIFPPRSQGILMGFRKDGIDLTDPFFDHLLGEGSLAT